MVPLLVALVLAGLALGLQRADGVRGYGNTAGALHAARTLWLLAAWFAGAWLGRSAGALAGLGLGVVVALAGEWLVEVLDLRATRLGPRPGARSGEPPLAFGRLARVEEELRAGRGERR